MSAESPCAQQESREKVNPVHPVNLPQATAYVVDSIGISWAGELSFDGFMQDLQTVTATSLLEGAQQIQAERAADYDQPEGERSMGKTVAAFNAIKGRDVLSESDGWLLMSLLKMVRDQSRQHAHLDSCKDLVSYSSLYGEARINGR